MNRCQGSIPAGTKVDRSMYEFIEKEAERLGVTLAEFIRRLLLMYRQSRDENTACDHCGEPVVMELTYS